MDVGEFPVGGMGGDQIFTTVWGNWGWVGVWVVLLGGGLGGTPTKSQTRHQDPVFGEYSRTEAARSATEDLETLKRTQDQSFRYFQRLTKTTTGLGT